MWYKNGCLRAVGAFGPLKVLGREHFVLFRAAHFALVLFASIKSKTWFIRINTTDQVFNFRIILNHMV